MAKIVKKVNMKTPVKSPLKPPNAMAPVRTMKGPAKMPSSMASPLPRSVSPPSMPNISLPPTWLGAFRRV